MTAGLDAHVHIQDLHYAKARFCVAGQDGLSPLHLCDANPRFCVAAGGWTRTIKNAGFVAISRQGVALTAPEAQTPA